MDNAILCKIEATIEKYELLQKGDHVLVALSGGADSVFLLNVLLLLREKFGLVLFAAHVNHGLRGDDALKDEIFCEKYCISKGVTLFTKKADVSKIAKQKSVSEEVAGRMVRYEFFEELCQKHNINKIATAHNENDNIETVLMRFFRGSGILGLCGIPYKNENIIRPILDISRDEIEQFLKENDISFVTDKTNLEEVYTRNKIRLRIIPEIEKGINAGLKKSLAANITLYNECSDFLTSCVNEIYLGVVTEKGFYKEIDCKKILSNHIYVVKSVIKKIISSYSVEATHDSVCAVLDVLNGKKKKINISGGLTVMSAYGKIFIYKDIPESFNYENVKDNVFIKKTGTRITFEKTNCIDKNAGKNVFFADGDKLKTLTVRSRKDGDSIVFGGNNFGKVKLKDFFINNKVPSFLRDSVPIVLSGEDIIWIAGFRYSKNFAAIESTKNIVKIEIKGGGV